MSDKAPWLLMGILLVVFFYSLGMCVKIIFTEKIQTLSAPIGKEYAGLFQFPFNAEQLNTTKTLKGRILDRAEEFALSKEYVANVYDCTQFTDDLQKILWHEFDMRSRNLLHKVNCSYDYWDRDNCKAFDGWHEFLEVFLPYGRFYVEATSGEEITEDMYPYYNL
nr:hypothetical protein 13 [bacterium]